MSNKRRRPAKVKVETQKVPRKREELIEVKDHKTQKKRGRRTKVKDLNDQKTPKERGWTANTKMPKKEQRRKRSRQPGKFKNKKLNTN